MPKQSREEVGMAQMKVLYGAKRGREEEKDPDIQRDNIRIGAGREGAKVRGVPRSSSSLSPHTHIDPLLRPSPANGEIP